MPFLGLPDEMRGAKRAAIGKGGFEENWPIAGDEAPKVYDEEEGGVDASAEAAWGVGEEGGRVVAVLGVAELEDDIDVERALLVWM